jgi:hypothetical protein
MATNPAYVLFAKKGNFRFSIRTPALAFGGAHIHIDRDDKTLVFPPEVLKLFNLKGTVPSKEPMGTFVSISYDLYGETKNGFKTAFVDRKAVGHYPESLLPPFEKFLDYLEHNNVEVLREVALGVYMNNIEEALTFMGYYPPKGTTPINVEKLSGRVGDIEFN